MPKVRVTNFDHPIDVDDAEIPSDNRYAMKLVDANARAKKWNGP